MRAPSTGSRPTLAALAVLSIAALAACTGSPASPSAGTSIAPASQAAAASATEPPPSVAETAPTEPSASAEASETAGPTAVATSIDPCQLLPKEEASKLAGVTFTAGKESTTDGNARICTYGAQTVNVFMVEVAIAPDVATAKAQEKAFQDQLDAAASQLPQGMKVTQLPGFTSDADAVLFDGTATISGQTIGGRAIYVLRGTTFFGFSDIALNHAPPSVDAVKAEAMTLLGRLP